MQTELFIDQNIPLKKIYSWNSLNSGRFFIQKLSTKTFKGGLNFFLVAMLKTTLFYDKEVEINWSENKIAIF